jgi:hypothetical protein
MSHRAHVRAQEESIRQLKDAALAAGHLTGFPIPEVERRLDALANACHALLLWERDARLPTGEELEKMEASGQCHDPAADYLCQHAHALNEALEPVRALGVRFAGTEGGIGDASSTEVGGPGKGLLDTGGSPCEPGKRQRTPDLSKWALGLDGKRTWQVFRRKGNRWEHQGCLDGLPAGNQTKLLEALAEGGGFLKKITAIKIWMDPYVAGEVPRIWKLVKPEMSNLRGVIRQAIGAREPYDPFPYDRAMKGWQAQVAVGYAVETEGDRADAETRLCFKLREELTSDERIDHQRRT